ncbi:hypothetical protein WAI453_013672 [Rhynchosporium graminicola]
MKITSFRGPMVRIPPFQTSQSVKKMDALTEESTISLIEMEIVGFNVKILPESFEKSLFVVVSIPLLLKRGLSRKLPTMQAKGK